MNAIVHLAPENCPGQRKRIHIAIGGMHHGFYVVIRINGRLDPMIDSAIAVMKTQ